MNKSFFGVFVSETQIRVEEKKSIEKKFFAFVFQNFTQTETWSLLLQLLLLACVCGLEHPLRLLHRPRSTASEKWTKSLEMNSWSSYPILKKGRTELCSTTIILIGWFLKIIFQNVFYSITVLQSNIWNIRLTLEQQTEGARKSFEQR